MDIVNRIRRTLGINNADNEFDSSNVVANVDGSALERLEYIQSQIGSDLFGLVASGTVDTQSGSTTSVLCSGLAGYGNDFFNTQYYIQILKNANSAGAAPEHQIRKITDYVSSTGLLTTDAFGANVETSDVILVLHESVVTLGRNDADNVFDSSLVVANVDGSVLERLQSIQDKVGAVDATDNILGANDADNGFDSSAVVANVDGSIVERLEDLVVKVTAVDDLLDTEISAITTKLAAPTADLATDATVAQVVGLKADTVAGTSLVSIGKQILAAVTIVDDYIDGAALEKLTGAADGGTNAYPDSVVQESVIAYMLSKSANPVTTSYDNTTDSLEAISDLITALTGKVVVASGTFTTDSATVPADTVLGGTKATGFYNGCLLMPTVGACAYQPRRIKTFATTTGIFTLESETPFTGVPGLSTYVVIADQATVGFNTAVPASPTAGSLNDILSKAAGGNTFVKATDSLEALADNTLSGGVLKVSMADTTVIPNNTQAAAGLLATASGDILIEEIIVHRGAVNAAGPTNYRFSTDNTNGLTGKTAPFVSMILAKFNANLTSIGSVDGTVKQLPDILESGKKLYIDGDDAATTGAVATDFYIKYRRLVPGATLV